jgi:hypothetical protein
MDGFDPDRALDLALDALERRDKTLASQLYEATANVLTPVRPADAAHLLVLAAAYGREDFERADTLAARGQLLWQHMERVDKASEMALLWASRAEQRKDLQGAKLPYVGSITFGAEHLAESAHASLTSQSPLSTWKRAPTVSCTRRPPR